MDYSALSHKVTLREAGEYARPAFFKFLYKPTNLGLVILVGLALLALGIGVGNVVIILTAASVLLASTLVIVSIYTMTSNIQLSYFARINGLALTMSEGKSTRYDNTTGTSLSTSELAGYVYKSMVGDLGRSKSQHSVIGNGNMSLQSYQYTTGSGKNSKVHHWTFGTHRLDRPMPHVLLDSKKNNLSVFGASLGSNLAGGVDRSQRIDAGVLSQHFDVYVPETYGVDALSIISPEIVEELVNHYQDYDIEILDSTVNMLKNGAYKPAEVKELFELIERLGEEFNDNLVSYRDERATTIAERVGIAEQGIRLRKSRVGKAIGLMIASWLVIIRLASHSPRIMVYALIASTAIGLSTAGYLRYTERNR